MSVLPEEAGPERNEAGSLESIAAFVDANDNLIQAAHHTLKHPSAQALAITYDFKGTAVQSLTPMVETKFFRTSKDEELISAATGAVLNTTKKLWETATQLRPDDPSHFDFDKSVHEYVVRALANEDEEDEEVRTAVAKTMSILCNTYEEAAANLLDKLMTSDSVIEYSLSVGNKAERRKRMINFGSVAAASFIGTSAALYLHRKKR